jgi:hypothetical protein
MEELTFRKDETPYLVFACKKCRQYSYVKTVQKTKKCLRCGRTHQVKAILSLGEIVSGMTEAVNTVKRRQTELATPEFRSEGDFVVAINKFPTRISVKKSKRKLLSDKSNDKNIDFIEQFSKILLELSKLYDKFPKYMLEIMADNYGIPASELKLLIKNFKKQGIITVLKNEDFYYQIELNLLSDLRTKNI